VITVEASYIFDRVTVHPKTFTHHIRRHPPIAKAKTHCFHIEAENENIIRLGEGKGRVNSVI
jgi:hypothetical protein